MVLLMLAASCWGVLQLAVLSLGTRTVRSGTLLLAFAAGAYACGVTAVLAELAYTRLAHALTGQPLREVVETAGYTVDPVIEEVVKLIPLVLVAVIIRRLRAQWGLTDFLLLGAAIGAGFAFLEAMLRFSGRASRALPDGEGGFILPLSLFPPHIHGLRHTVTSWLPPPVETLDLLRQLRRGREPAPGLDCARRARHRRRGPDAGLATMARVPSAAVRRRRPRRKQLCDQRQSE